MRYPRRSQCKYAKSRYRVRNWAIDQTGLQRRGALTVRLSYKIFNTMTSLGRPDSVKVE